MPSAMIESILARLVEGDDLTADDAQTAIEAVMSGRCSDAQIAALLVAFRTKGETPEEIAGAVLALRRHMVRVDAGRPDLLDTCGTGGDGAGTFNISTATALVVAAC